MVEIRLKNSKVTNAEARHIASLLETKDKDKRDPILKTAFLKGNFLNLLTDWMMIIKCNTAEAWSSWSKGYRETATSVLRDHSLLQKKTSGICQQPNIPNLLWQWGKLIYWGDTATKWVDFIDWPLLNWILYIGSRQVMSGPRIKQTRSVWWVCIKGCCASLRWGNSWTDSAVDMERSLDVHSFM